MKIAFRVVEVAAVLVFGTWALTWALGLVSENSNTSVLLGLGIVVALVAIAAAVANVWLKRLWPLIAKLAILMVVAFGATGCGTTINPGYAGIVVDYYGKDRGVQSFTATTGRVWYNPWTTKVMEYPTFVQSVVWTQNPGEGRPANEEITFTNKDQMKIAADVALSYHLDVTKLPAFYVKFRSDDLAQFTYGYLHSLARDKFNELGGKYSIEQIMGDNGPFLKEVRDALQKDLDPIGVQLENQFGIIGAPRPPETVTGAINLKAQAQQVSLQKEMELRQVQADAAKAIAKADGEAKAAIVAAEGQARANQLLNASLTDHLIELKRLEKWDGKLPTVSGGATPFINLNSK
jgi:regulator of protease activity HflC (stomatin/prohibitin superfamily)